MGSSEFEHIPEEENSYVESLEFVIGLFFGILPFLFSSIMIFSDYKSAGINLINLIILGFIGIVIFFGSIIWYKKDEKINK